MNAIVTNKQETKSVGDTMVFHVTQSWNMPNDYNLTLYNTNLYRTPKNNILFRFYRETSDGKEVIIFPTNFMGDISSDDKENNFYVSPKNYPRQNYSLFSVWYNSDRDEIHIRSLSGYLSDYFDKIEIGYFE
jgi:hypothetical protein